MASRAIPSHLKPSAAEGGEGGFSSQRHHGKSQSHVVSRHAPTASHAFAPEMSFTVSGNFGGSSICTSVFCPLFVWATPHR